MFFLWPGMVSCASVPRGIATSIFHFNSVALSESSLGHRYQSSPKCKAEAFCSTLRVAPSRLTWVSGSRAYSGYFECCLSNGIPGGSVVKNPPATQKTWVRSLGWKVPWRRNWEPTPVFSLGKSHGQRSLSGCMVQTCEVAKSQTQLSKHTCPPFVIVWPSNWLSSLEFLAGSCRYLTLDDCCWGRFLGGVTGGRASTKATPRNRSQ